MALTYEELLGIQQKRKKKEEEARKKIAPNTVSDIAPYKLVEKNVKSGFTAPTASLKPTVTTSKKDEDDSGLLKKSSYFDDGYDFGDISKTVIGSVADLGEWFSKGVIEAPEKILDGLTVLGTAMNRANMNQANFNMMSSPLAVTKKGNELASGLATQSKAIQKESEKEAAKFIAKDLYDSGEIAKKIIRDTVTDTTGIDVQSASVFGDQSRSLAESAGNMMAVKLADLILPGAGTLAMGLSAGGGELEEALRQGATYDEAMASGIITAGAEMAGGALFNGVKFGGETLTAGAVKKVATALSGKVMQTLAKWGINTVGEGAEELVSDFISSVGRKVTYLDEKEFNEIFNKESAWESFLGGMIMGGFFEGVDIAASKVTGTDYVTGESKNALNENVKTVFDKVVEDRITKATEENNGKTISKKDESKIRNEVLRAIDNGSLDTEEIESILGGEEYETYKRVRDKGSAYESKLNEAIEHYQAEYDSFSDIPRGEMTRNQLKREAEVEGKLEQLKAELEEYKKDTRTSDLKNKLSQNVFEMVKDTRLAESYREIERSKYKYEADVSKYKNEKARQTVQNAIDSGLFRNTNADHDAVDLMAKVASKIGLVVEFTTNEKMKNDYIELQTKQIAELEKIPEAYRDNEKLAKMKEALAKVQSGKRKVNGSTKKGVITINLDSVKPVEFITGHELLHNLIKSKVYKNGDLHKAFKSYLGDEKYAEKLKKVEQTYEGNEATPEEELAANLVGEYIFNDYDFVMHLATTNHNIFQNAWDSIKHLYNMATAGSKEARELERVKRNFEKAYKEAVKTGAKGEGTKYDVVALKNGNVYVKASRKVVNGTTVDEMRKDISRFFNRLLEENSSLDIPTIDGDVLTITKTETADKARDNYKTVNNQRVKMTDDEFTVKMHIEAHIDEVAEVSMPAGKKSDSKAHSFAKDGFTYRKAYFEDFDGEYYEVTLSIGQNGTVATVYNVGKIEKSVLPSAKISAVVGSKPLGKTLSEKSISQNSEKSSSEKHSLSETDNEYLSAVNSGDTETAQKIVDEVAKENGYTIKAYHGGDKFFTVFGKGNKTSQAPEGAHFFSSNKDVAYSYTTYKRDVNTDVNSYPVYKQLTREGTFEENRVARGGVYSSFLKLENPYIVDFEGEYYSRKIDGRDINEIATYARDNGYDGVIAKNIKDPGDMGDVNWESKPSLAVADDYIVFNPNQIKSAEAITYDDNGNVIPLSERFKTESNDIRFSLSENVEETKDLMALHNLHSNELMKQLQMGGIPYPSVAVTKPDALSHEDFGDVTLVLKKDAIDPKKSKYNKIYSADAYTPTFPNVNYEANRDVANNIADKVKSLYDAIPEDYKRSLTAFRDFTNIDERLNSARGEQGLIERYADDYSFKQLYLADKGEVVPTKIKRTETEISEVLKENYQFVVDKLGKELLESSKPMDSYTPPLTARVQWYEQHGESLKEAFAEYWADDGTMTKEEALEIANSESARYWVREIKAITDYIKTGGITIKEETDIPSTNALIDEKINAAEYKEWLSNLFSGIEGSSGIRNSKDLFTPSGKRRSFSQLHDPVTIDNVIKVMRKQGQTGQGAFGTGNIQGASAQEFGSIAEMKANSDRLGVMDEAEHKEITQQINDRIFEIAERYSNGKDLMDARTSIVEAVSKYETKEGIARYLKQFDYVYKYTDSIGDDIIELRDYIRSIPTPYFEAKPQRAVSFDEVAAFVIPRDADIKVKQELLNKGYSIAEYDPKVEGDRQRVVNSFEEYKFSLSDTTETSKGYATFYGRKIANRNIPLADIAPVKGVAEDSSVVGTVSKTEQVGTVNEDDYAPMTEAEAEAMMTADKDYINSFTDADMPHEVDAPIYDRTTEGVKVDSPLEDRDIYEVGNKKVKAYMYENPEVKPFFQDAANIMLGDLHDTIRGERTFNDELYYESGGELGWMGTKRHTSPEIADLLDNWHYTYDQIERGLKAIIEDNGAENNAVSKRIEFALDEILRNGHTFFADGTEVPPNQEYINLLLGKEITEYNDEAFNYWVSTLSEDDVMSDDFVHDDEAQRETVDYTEAEEIMLDALYNQYTLYDEASRNPEKILNELKKSDDDIAPTKAYEAIRPKPVKQPKMARVNKVSEAQRQSEEILGESQVGTKTPEKNKGGTWSDFVRNFVSKGAVFESLKLKTGNRAVEDKYKMWKDRSGTKAQYFMEHGKGNVKSLKTITETVRKSGLEKEFDLYMKHRLNVDRMKVGKPVFGDDVTAEMSMETASKLQKQHPEFREWAKDVYAYNDYLRQMLVDGGIVSKETADLWAKQYPNYIPIERLDKGGAFWEGKGVGIAAPIKRATGGNSSTEYLLKTLAHRTTQVFKAVDKNAFGVELKNTLKSEIGETETNTEGAIEDLVAMDEGLLQPGKNGKNPTFTVFENGERVTFEISEEMYKALQPTTEALSREHKILSKPSAWHKKVLTEYNLFFTARNFPKDAQEVIFNSNHAAKTYANMPVAFKELLTGKGKYVTEYWENGGKSNTYFDERANDFMKDDTFVKKAIGLAPNGISKVNDFVEAIPRLAEYIASRKNGATIEAAMVDAARVTTDFSDGGDITKFLNRNGVTFLNASVQGAAQQVRNIREAKAEGIKGVMKLAGKYALTGLPILLFNSLMWDDDEEYEELSDYVKDNYYIVAKYGDGQFVRIPKGRTAAVIQEAFKQLGNTFTGKETDWANVLSLAKSNLSPNNPIDNNILAPIKQVATNTAWYGDDIVPTRLQDMPTEEQYDETIDSISKWLGENFDPFDLGPYKINYLLNQYSGFVGDMTLPYFTPEAENDISPVIAPLADQFTVDSVIKNRNASDFYTTKEELTVKANSKNATDEDILKGKYINSVNTELSDLYKEKREIQNSNLSDDLKFKQVRDVQKQINELSKNALNTYENVKVNGRYATIGDRHYMLNDKGEWQKITDEQLEKQNEAIGILGITPSQYWSNKKEYDMAAFYPEKYAILQQEGISVEDYKENYEESAFIYTDDYSWAANNPEKYTLSKAVTDDFAQYREYTSALNEIKADKDENGKTISGSAKEKKKAYIWSLPIDYGQKVILYRSLYDSKEDKATYNQDIIDYLISREDITYDEMNTICEELGFEVNRETGQISW